MLAFYWRGRGRLSCNMQDQYFDFEKNLDYDLRIKTGVEYEVVDNFFLRGGVATMPVELSFGLGYRWKQIQLGLGSSYHQILGWSPHFGLVYQGAKKAK